MEQGSQEWKSARLGNVTASRFKDVMTNGRGKDTMGQTAYSYMLELMVERLTENPCDEISAAALEWGNDHEPDARRTYCLEQNVRVVKEGFLTHPEIPRAGCSPDGLVEGDAEGPGGVEIKCPHKSRIHLGYLEQGQCPKSYEWQVQGSMWVTGRGWWDFVSYDPRLRASGLSYFRVRVYRDDEKCAALTARVNQFLETMDARLKGIIIKSANMQQVLQRVFDEQQFGSVEQPEDY